MSPSGRTTPTIAARLTRINLLVSGAALVLATIAFGAYDQITALALAERNLSIQAQIAGANSVTALVFDDPDTAEITLATLRAAPNIVSAEIRTAANDLLAQYRRDEAGLAPTELAIPTGQSEALVSDGQQIGLSRRIEFQGREVGRVLIRRDIDDLNQRRNRYIAIGLVVLSATLVAALFLSWRPQRAVAEPIQTLADLARRVSADKDYTMRARIVGNTREIETLVGSFNEMMSEIQQRDASLRDAHDRLEARVRERTAALDEANKELEAFSYSVSHDLRAPLRHVAGFAGLLERRAGAGLDDQSRGYLEKIVLSANRMGRLIDDLLSFSRMARTDMVSHRVSLNDLVRQSVQEVSVSRGAQAKPVDWRIGRLPDVEGDQAMLRQVVLNLLSNAVKYSATNGAPIITIDSMASERPEVIVFVRDNGVGFDMQYAHKLFGVFQRLHGIEDFEGTGIGLANVKRIIVRHGGRVWAEGAVGQGATFYVALPKRADSTATN